MVGIPDQRFRAPPAEYHCPEAAIIAIGAGAVHSSRHCVALLQPTYSLQPTTAQARLSDENATWNVLMLSLVEAGKPSHT